MLPQQHYCHLFKHSNSLQMIFNIKCFQIHKYTLHHLGVWFTSFDIKVGRGIKRSCDFLRYFTRKTWEVLICSMLFDPNVVTTFCHKNHFGLTYPPSFSHTLSLLSRTSTKFAKHIGHFCHNGGYEFCHSLRPSSTQIYRSPLWSQTSPTFVITLVRIKFV